MLDLKTVYLRNALQLRDLQLLATLRLIAPPSGTPMSVSIDGFDSPFIVAADGTLLAVRPGAVGPQLSGWRVRVTVREDDGAVRVLAYDESGVLELVAALQVSVDNTATVVDILLNNASTKYAVISSTVLAVEVPPGTKQLGALTILAETQQLTQVSMFEFVWSKQPTMTSGLAKVLAQFLKVLLTSPGSDLARPTIGVGLRQVLGKMVPNNNAASILAVVTQYVANAALQVTQSQTGGRIPASEHLLQAQIVELGLDPNDPTKLHLALSLLTLDGAQTTFGLSLATGA